MRRRPSFIRTVAELLAGMAAGIQEFRKASREIQDELGLLPAEQRPELDESDWRVARIILSMFVLLSYAGCVLFFSAVFLPNRPIVFILACFFAGLFASTSLRAIFRQQV